MPVQKIAEGVSVQFIVVTCCWTVTKEQMYVERDAAFCKEAASPTSGVVVLVAALDARIRAVVMVLENSARRASERDLVKWAV